MRNVLVSTLAILLLLLMAPGVSATSLAPDYTRVGINLHDTAVYHTIMYDNPDDVNKTTIEFYGIVGTVVTVHRTDYAPSGAVKYAGVIVGDISDGSGDPMYLYLVTPGLTAGDRIYSGAGFLVNDTRQMTVAGRLRAVNHMRGFGGSPELYWDQLTGVMIERHTYQYGYWINMSLLSTTAWQPYNPFNIYTIALILVVVVCILVIALVVVTRKRSRRRGKK